MTLEIPKSRAAGEVYPPYSKSILQRYIICAALSRGESVIKGFSFSDDVAAALNGAKAFGSETAVSGNTITVRGAKVCGNLPEADCKSSAATLRFLMPVAAALYEKSVFTGSENLFFRPLSVYEELFCEKGIAVIKEPRKITLKGKLKSGEYVLHGDVSSQFISGLLLALPLLPDDSVIRILPPVNSAPYIEMTRDCQKKFGVVSEYTDSNTIYIKGGQKYSPANVLAERDFSAAAYFGLLRFFGNEVETKDMPENSLQADAKSDKLLESLLCGIPVNISDCPDIAPVLFCAAASLKSKSVITGTRRLKYKESDRALCMKTELEKLGVKLTVSDDSVTVNPEHFHAPEVPLDSHGDHRIAMALSVLLTLKGGIICGCESVKKSYPDFYKDLISLGVKIKGDTDFES